MPHWTPLFEQRARETFDRSTKTLRERGSQYGDTWRNCRWLMLRAVVKELFSHGLSDVQCQAIAAAIRVDEKYSRFEGGWNQDHAIDGINIEAFLVAAMRIIKPDSSAPSATSAVNSLPPDAHDQVYS